MILNSHFYGKKPIIFIGNNRFIFYKDNASRKQNKINLFIFSAEVQLIL